MSTYKTQIIDDLPIDHITAEEEQIVVLMNFVATKINNCVQSLGTIAEIKSIEHFETYTGVAENSHIKFITKASSLPGNTLKSDGSSIRISDYDYAELTKVKIHEDE